MTDSATISEPTPLAEERQALAAADVALARMVESASAIGDTAADALASESLGRMRAERLAALAANPEVPAFFGRIDTVAAGDDPAESFHIGRRHVRDDHGDPLVLDWRAPVAGRFYRASTADPHGLRRRRRFGFSGRTLTSYEDERFDGDDAGEMDGVSDLVRQEVERPREGPMRDIVATISPDQDDLVRADLDVSLCVQGAPGTGKTAVGLHRAAYLLYTYPERLRRSGVLVVGPNEAFLRYIEAVLPTLGEVGVRQATVAGLVGTPARPAAEPADLATLKGDLRLAEALRRAVLRHVAKPDDDVVVTGGPLGTRRYRVSQDRVRRYVDDARREVAAGSLHWSTARARVATRIAEDVRRQREDAGGAPSDRETAALARRPEIRAYLDTVWPALSPEQVLTRFYADDAFRARCTPDLDDDERAALARPVPTRGRTRATAADAVLLDELRGLIDGTETVGHVVVDEAQDLSPMQCRALARRCPTGSFTVLGDLAQATTPWAPGSWEATLAALGRPDAVSRPLTLGYRVPGSVLALTNRLLPHVAVGLQPADSLRDAPDALSWSALDDAAVALEAALARPGTVGVIAADDVLARLRETLGPVADERVEFVPAGEAKGLEFDTVLVADPAGVVAAEPSRVVGLRRLYVVLTRAVSHLVVLRGADEVPELEVRPSAGGRPV